MNGPKGSSKTSVIRQIKERSDAHGLSQRIEIRTITWGAGGVFDCTLPGFSQNRQPSPQTAPPPVAVESEGKSEGEPSAFQPLTEPFQVSQSPCDCPQCQAAAKGQSSSTYKTCCHGKLLDWSKYPTTIHPMPRPGIFPLPPTQGRNYYSLYDCLTNHTRPAAPKSGYAPFAINAGRSSMPTGDLSKGFLPKTARWSNG